MKMEHIQKYMKKPFVFSVLLLPAEHRMIWLNMTRKPKRLNEQQGSDLDIRDQTR